MSVLKKRPTAFIVRYKSGEFDLFKNEEQAARQAEWNDVEYHGLYERDGTPLEAVTDARLPTYGHIPFAQLGRDVREAQMGVRLDYPFHAEGYPGHDMVDGLNFNSLNRIVSKYAPAVPSPSIREAAKILWPLAEAADSHDPDDRITNWLRSLL